MPTSYKENIPTIISLMQQAAPAYVADYGVGNGKYGLLAREYVTSLKHLTGYEGTQQYIDKFKWLSYVYDTLFVGDFGEEVATHDLYLMIDIIEHLDKARVHRMLTTMTRYGQVIISTPKEDYRHPYHETPLETHISHWALDDFVNYQIEDYSNDLATLILIKAKAV